MNHEPDQVGPYQGQDLQVPLHVVPVQQRIGIARTPDGNVAMLIVQPCATFQVTMNAEAATRIAHELLEHAGGIQVANEQALQIIRRADGNGQP